MTQISLSGEVSVTGQYDIGMDHLRISLGHDARTITSVGKDASRSMKKLVLNDNTETESTMKLSAWDKFGWIDNLVTKIIMCTHNSEMHQLIHQQAKL